MLDLEALSGLLRTPDAAEAWRGFGAFLGNHGLDRLILYDVTAPTPGLWTTFAPDWLRHYQAQGYAAIDPFLTHCLDPAASVPTGAAYLDRLGHLAPRQRDLIAEAGEAGFNAGFSLVLAPGGMAWNIGSGLRPREVAALRLSMGPRLPLALRLMQARLRPAPALSEREAEALEWLAAGLRVKEIAHRMGIAPVTVELHLKSARTRLGARTRDQALLQAALHGAIRLSAD
ncbi:LuxR family transcriptional regulator [Falsiroseomonas sp.]|uniref:helix-turn-helix transcriptional regulator n=1 Tax=Falsiroseomonas sp. TaxID=2870721 RepID=UPI002723BE4C|nr:LuxR family transcriptional regulator [Falsiroseomonas sp.]MDO9499794.1 LuxR C-terminal-related transcriptional regulator [Falsiroseomonas sp.]